MIDDFKQENRKEFKLMFTKIIAKYLGIEMVIVNTVISVSQWKNIKKLVEKLVLD